MRARNCLWFALLLVTSTGCQCIQQIEQWKCDNWGMCHFAPQRPGVYTPMVVAPTYGAAPSPIAATPVYPPQGTPISAVPPTTYAAPTYAAPVYGGQAVPSGSCRECQN